MQSRLRDFFDSLLEQVLANLPLRLRKLLDEVPLIVEDYPSTQWMHQLGVSDRGALCGLYSGVPLSARSVVDTTRMPDQVMIFREGILNAAAGANGQLTEEELSRQIRITVLHELGHYHGLDEEELRKLGYG